MMTVARAVLLAMRAMDRECSIPEVREWISINLNAHWADIGTAMADLTIRGNNSSTYRLEQQFLERVRRGVYRLSAAFRD